MTKSRDLKSEMFKGQASIPYNKTGTHLLYNNCRVTSSEAILPILYYTKTLTILTFLSQVINVNLTHEISYLVFPFFS